MVRRRKKHSVRQKEQARRRSKRRREKRQRRTQAGFSDRSAGPLAYLSDEDGIPPELLDPEFTEALTGPSGPEARRALEKAIEALSVFDVPQPDSWPGGCHPLLARPDLVKADLAEYVTAHRTGGAAMRRLEEDYAGGPLSFLDNIDHWAMEEFLWHGAPGDGWHPVDAFLKNQRDRFPQEARDQLRLWKQAELGAFELGDVSGDTLELRRFDPLSGRTTGEPFRAIALNVGGVNAYRRHRGKVTMFYLAPWAPEENLFCGMGYGFTLPKRETAWFQAHMYLRRPEFASRRWPWNVDARAKREHRARWRTREWHGWLKERIETPFEAFVPLRGDGRLDRVLINELMPSPPEAARQFGIYLITEIGREAVVVGATTVKPADFESANFAALAEYSAWRMEVGPPPGTVGKRIGRRFD